MIFYPERGSRLSPDARTSFHTRLRHEVCAFALQKGEIHMGLFGKSKAKKHSIIEVIKYDGPNDVLIWKFPNEDFNTNTQLVVGPAQEAIFISGGEVVERFKSGTYTLSTKNYPFVRSLVGMVTGGVSPFSCTVYYVNKVISMGIPWGTDSAISVMDPVAGLPVEVRSYGDFSLQVENGQKLLEKLVGQTMGYSHEEVWQYFGNLMSTQIRSVISGSIQEGRLSLIGIDAHLPMMSKLAEQRLRPIFDPFGMEINHFTIAAVKTSDLQSLIAKMHEIQGKRMDSEIKNEIDRRDVDTQAYANKQLGISEQEKIAGKIGQSLANNHSNVPAGGISVGYPGMMNTGFQGMMNVGFTQSSGSEAGEIAQAFINKSNNMFNQPAQNVIKEEPAPQKAEKSDYKERIDRLKYALDIGAITQEAYNMELQEILKGS